MGTAARTQPLSPNLWLTDEKRLLFVLDLAEQEGQAIVEDARSGEIECIPAKCLEGWRVVEPADAA